MGLFSGLTKTLFGSSSAGSGNDAGGVSVADPNDPEYKAINAGITGNNAALDDPAITDAISNLSGTAQDLQTEGNQIGDFTSPGGQADFNMRYEPMLNRLSADFDTKEQGMLESANDRGVLGGTSQAYDQSLLSREFARELGNQAQTAQAGAEGQRLNEFQAKGTILPNAEAAPANLALQKNSARLANMGGLQDLYDARLGRAVQNHATNAAQNTAQQQMTTKLATGAMGGLAAAF